MRRIGVAARLYRAALRLLPPDTRPDREDMARAFEGLWRDAGGRGARVAVAVRSFGRLPAVAVVEWLEYVGARRAPGRTNTGRGGVMGFWRNVRFALRTLRRAPLFAVTSILLVAVGIGAVTTIFTLVDHVLLRPLPYPDADRLAYIDEGSHTGPLFRAVEGFANAEVWAAASGSEVNLVGVGDPQRLEQARVNLGFFDVFGMRASLGRLLVDEDFRAADAVVLDHGAWRRIWGADPGVVGRTIDLDGEPVVVVGVASPDFSPPEALVGGQVDLWRPIDWSLELLGGYDYHVLQLAARLAPGATLEALQEELDAVVARFALESENYRQRDSTEPRDIPVLSLSEVTVRGARTGLGLLMGAVALLLLVACANVAHLFLARGLARTREMAVRRAMGAGTGSLTAQLLIESLVVGLMGGALGAALAWAGVSAFVALNPSALPRQSAVSIDPRVLAFAVAVSALTSLVFGLVPALRSVRTELADELRGAARTATTGRGVTLLRNAMVSGEVALSLVLVAGAALLAKSFLTVRGQDPGFEVENVWTVPLTVTEVTTPEQYVTLMDGILESVRRVPGVRSAAYGLTMPLERTRGTCCWSTSLSTEGATGEPVQVMRHPVTDAYFETLGIERLAGRMWNEAEARAETPPVVISATLAGALFGSPTDAIGRVLISPRSGQAVGEVVGVVADTRHYGLDRDRARDRRAGNDLYQPMESLPFAIDVATVAAKVEPAAGTGMPRALREAVWAAAPRLPVPTVSTIEEWRERSVASRRFESLVFGVFGLVALLLAAGGLYGTLLYVAGQRRQELGIRLALGASRGRLERQVVVSGVAMGAIGVVLGLAGAVASGKLLESRIWGVEPGDPATLAGAAALLLATTVLASWAPARRAGRVDPVETLRVE